MNFSTWEPVYEAILEDFGYDRSGDERARDVLAEFARPFPIDLLENELGGKTVAIAGAGPSLEQEIELAAGADRVIAASTAVDHLHEAGISVDLMVTDLDKNPDTACRLSRESVPVAIHAHGDNIRALRRFVPRFDVEQVLATTQAEPVSPVENFGGFTDGDRGAFLADHFGAGRLVFLGWDFDDTSVGLEKRRKLRWAERLLEWLERRRDERFSILEGRHDTISEPIARSDGQ